MVQIVTAQSEVNATDTVVFGVETSQYIKGQAAGVGEEMYGGGGNDILLGSTYNGDWSGSGSSVDPFLFGTFVANSGDDWLFGEEGNDLIYGGDGNDIISGGDGSDGVNFALIWTSILYYADGGLHGGDGNDTIYGDAGNDLLYGDAGIDKLYGGDDNDTIKGGVGNDTAQGDNGNDIIQGEDGGDILYGNLGNDRLLGGANNDWIFGGLGSDSLYGDAGNDVLNGGAGIDFLKGGAGIDKFQFMAVVETGDNIRDFDASDFIVLKGSVFGGLAAGALSANRFWSNATGLAHDGDDRFIYNTATDALHYDSNGNAAGGTKVLIADISNDFNMTFQDILIA